MCRAGTGRPRLVKTPEWADNQACASLPPCSCGSLIHYDKGGPLEEYPLPFDAVTQPDEEFVGQAAQTPARGKKPARGRGRAAAVDSSNSEDESDAGPQMPRSDDDETEEVGGEETSHPVVRKASWSVRAGTSSPVWLASHLLAAIPPEQHVIAAWLAGSRAHAGARTTHRLAAPA
jgi:hypothetical protein